MKRQVVKFKFLYVFSWEKDVMKNNFKLVKKLYFSQKYKFVKKMSTDCII